MPLLWLAVGLALSALSYVIMPKPKQASAAQDPTPMDNPKAEAGRPMPVVFGEVTCKSLFILWYGDKDTGEYEVSA